MPKSLTIPCDCTADVWRRRSALHHPAIGSRRFQNSPITLIGCSTSYATAANRRATMPRYRYPTMLAAVVFLVTSISACSTGRSAANRLATAPSPARSSAVIFPPTGPLAYSRPQSDTSDGPAGATIPWEITRTHNAGQTRVSAVRRNGDVTEYYTSSSGANGSTGIRRASSRTTNFTHNN